MVKGGTGLEPQDITDAQQNTYDDTPKETVHNQVHYSHFSSDLQLIIDRWDDLPEHVKTAINALIQNHITEIE